MLALRPIAAILGAALLLAACGGPEPDDGTAIPGLTADRFQAALERAGARCERQSPFIVGDFTVSCVLVANSLSASTSGRSETHLRQVDANSLEASLGDTTTWFEAVAGVEYEGADPPRAQAWVREALANPACVPGAVADACSIVVGRARLTAWRSSEPEGEANLAISRAPEPGATIEPESEPGEDS